MSEHESKNEPEEIHNNDEENLEHENISQKEQIEDEDNNENEIINNNSQINNEEENTNENIHRRTHRNGRLRTCALRQRSRHPHAHRYQRRTELA